LFDRFDFFHMRKQSPKRQQRPPPVDAAVPIETAKEDRVKLSWRKRVLNAEEHMVELVRIFFRDVPQRDPRQVRGKTCVQLHRNAAK
jgi:hypothetical protein